VAWQPQSGESGVFNGEKRINGHIQWRNGGGTLPKASYQWRNVSGGVFNIMA